MLNTNGRIPIPGEIIESKSKKACITETCRVLNVSAGLDRIDVIPVTPRKSNCRYYFIGPRTLVLSKVVRELGRNVLIILKNGIIQRSDGEASDEDLDKKYLRPGQEVSYPRKERHVRYEIIRPLVDDQEDRKLLFDPQVRVEKIAARANELTADKSKLMQISKRIGGLLNQYFAGGSTKGALTPFSDTKGGRNKEREQKNKLGRSNALTKAKQKGLEGFVMQEIDKKQCGFAWRNYYVRNSTIAKALRRMWREFYSDTVTKSDGKLLKRLYPEHQRPTRTQFVEWGQRRSPGHESWKKQFTKLNLNRIDRVLLGSASDNVVAIGQRGSTDSTSPDIEFVSVVNRTDRIGPAHRILVVDAMYNYISGFYLGLDAPSAETLNLAFLHSLTDKTEWLKWLGLTDQKPEFWIPIRYSSVLADNTDARCEGAIKSLDSIGTGLKFVAVARSDMNSPSETSHHTLHRMVDHNFHGTSYGQRLERGEERADILARHTIVEAIRETARAVYTHNTTVLDIRPTLEMKRELVEKGILLTRANLTRWEINRGNLSVCLIGEDEARRKLMPVTRGTFTKHGVKLLRPDTGKKREFIEPVRYVSKHPKIAKKFLKANVERARVTADSYDDEFKHDPYKPSEVYWRDPIDGELIRLEITTDDKDLPFECTYNDVIDMMKRDQLYLFYARNSKQESFSNMEAGQDQTKQDAEDAYQADLEKLDKKPSKSSMRRNKKKNREREKDMYQYGMPVQYPPGTSETGSESEPTDSFSEEPAADVSQEPPQKAAEQEPNLAGMSKDASERVNASQEDSMILQSIRRRRQQQSGGNHGK